ncbi:hypothetical protein [Rickettsia conorii]|uniref:Uncharacterized protein n=1 Tax=Rickettsia conorii (strain ATCC VR-613 / Malish 7) TaxID=272944 RepID=Q92HI4_RICCN|nr:hypothetical protein [Rickettsia conorii]AAL03325.1 unknown [Rickettsia conorii str. Malish 7]
MLNPKSILKLIIFLSIFLLTLYGVNFALHWHNPDVNNEVADDIGICLYKNAHKSLQVNSMGIAFPNAEKDCFNPSFPIIHTKTDAKHNTWFHIVRTDLLG